MCQCPHFRWKWYCVHGWLLQCTTKNLYHLISRTQTILILHCNWLWGRANFIELLNAILSDDKLFVPYLTVYSISLNCSIGEEFFDDLWVYHSNWIQQLGPSSFFKHFRDEGVLNGFQLNYPFHDNGGFVVTAIVLHVSFSRLEAIRISACTLGRGFLGGCC